MNLAIPLAPTAGAAMARRKKSRSPTPPIDASIVAKMRRPDEVLFIGGHMNGRIERLPKYTRVEPIAAPPHGNEGLASTYSVRAEIVDGRAVLVAVLERAARKHIGFTPDEALTDRLHQAAWDEFGRRGFACSP